MSAILGYWLALDPVWRVAIVFAVVTSIANWATYPNDPAEWERIKLEEPRRAGVITFLRGFGFYPAKILRGLSAILFGAKGPPSAAELVAKLRGMFLGVIVLGLVGCGASRASMRGAVLVSRDAVKLADAMCAELVLEAPKHGTPVATAIKIGEACDRGYTVARPAVILAARAVDADDVRGAACALLEAEPGLRAIVDACASGGVKVPALVSDGLELAARFGGFCGR